MCSSWLILVVPRAQIDPIPAKEALGAFDLVIRTGLHCKFWFLGV